MSLLETAEWDNLLAGQDPDVVTRSITLNSGQNVVRGQVGSFTTASGKGNAYDSTSSAGVELPRFIFAEDCDASLTEQTAIIYIGGCFNPNQLTFAYSGDSVTHALRETLRDYGIILKETQAA